MPRNIRTLVACIACAIAVAVPARATTEDSAVPWLTDLPRALAQSAETGKPIIVDVWAVWCVPCHEMDDKTYRDPAVVEAIAAGFVPLKIDADVNEAFRDRHRIGPLPTTLVLDDQAGEITRVLGFVGASRMVELLGATREGYGAYRADRGAMKQDPAKAIAVAGYLQRAGNAFGASALLRRTLKAAKDVPPALRERLELALAEAQLASDDLPPPVDAFTRLADQAADREVRARALAGLARAERERGRTAEAERALARLQAEYPELAQSLLKP